MDPEAPTVVGEFRGLMEDDLSGRVVVALAAEARFVDLVPGRAYARGDDIRGRVDRDEGGGAGDEGREMVERPCAQGMPHLRRVSGRSVRTCQGPGEIARHCSRNHFPLTWGTWLMPLGAARA